MASERLRSELPVCGRVPEGPKGQAKERMEFTAQSAVNQRKRAGSRGESGSELPGDGPISEGPITKARHIGFP